MSWCADGLWLGLSSQSVCGCVCGFFLSVSVDVCGFCMAYFPTINIKICGSPMYSSKKNDQMNCEISKHKSVYDKPDSYQRSS